MCKEAAVADAGAADTCEAPSRELQELQSRFPQAEAEELFRFLNKQSGDISKAAKIYQDCLAWRAETLPISDNDIGEASEWMWLYGKAKDETDILFVQGAKYDPDLASSDQYVLQTAKIMSRFPATSTQKITVLVDVRAYEELPSAPAMKLLPYLKSLAPLMNDFFPGRLKSLVVYPVPRAAAAIWGLIRGFLSKSTASKVVLLSGSDSAGSPAPDELWSYVEREQLAPTVQESHRCVVPEADR